MSDFQNNQYQAPQAPVQPQAPVAPAAPVAPQAPQQGFNLPQANAPAGNPVDQAKEAAQKVLKNKNLPMIAGIVVAVVVVILLASLLFGKGYEKPIDKYFDTMYKGKVKNIESLMPKEAWEYIVDEYEYLDVEDVDELIEGIEEGYTNYYEDELTDNYGEFDKYDYEIKKAKKVSDNKLEKIAESLADNYDIDEDSVKKAYKLEFDGEILFEDEDIDLDDRELYSVKVGGKWYVVSGYDEYYHFVGASLVEFYDYE